VLAEGNGIILALPHVGNRDSAAAWAVAHGHRLVTVAERLKPERVFEQFVAYREALGMEVIPLTGSARPPIDLLAERAGQGFAVALLSDRDLSSRGVEVRFFGGRTRMPAGPALLALRTRAPLYAVDIWYSADRVEAEIRPIELPAESEGTLAERVRLVTQRLADAYEIGIARHPQDWHMLQKLWLSDRV
jgi:phosphatidylinositol dimannoside acyltransferase